MRISYEYEEVKVHQQIDGNATETSISTITTNIFMHVFEHSNVLILKFARLQPM